MTRDPRVSFNGESIMPGLGSEKKKGKMPGLHGRDETTPTKGGGDGTKSTMKQEREVEGKKRDAATVAMVLTGKRGGTGKMPGLCGRDSSTPTGAGVSKKGMKKGCK